MMKRKTIGILTLIGILLIPVLSRAQLGEFKTVKPESVGMSSSALEEMKAHFHQLVDEQRIAGIQTAVLRKGKLVHFDTYGQADIANDEPLNEESIFRIFSMTKPIVSVALMQLYEQGKFQLHDPIHQYLPEFKEMYVQQDSSLVKATRDILIVDLLRHTSGFSYGRGSNSALNQQYASSGMWSSFDNKEFCEKVSKIPLQFEPGTNWQYGISTNIVGRLIEVLSGKPLDQYLKESIFQPLKMINTGFQVPKEKIKHLTVGYRWSEDQGLGLAEIPEESRFAGKVTLFVGGGGLVSTTADYLRFCQMLLNKGSYGTISILQEETVDLMWRDHLVEVREHGNDPHVRDGEAGFGLGFAIKGESPDRLEKVYGWGGAVGTYFRVDSEQDLVYLLMIQLSPYRQLRLRELFQYYVNAAVLKG